MSLKIIATIPVVAMLAVTPASKASAQGVYLSNVRVDDLTSEEARYFKINQDMGLCPYGTWVYYNGNWHNYNNLVIYYEDGSDLRLMTTLSLDPYHHHCPQP